MEDKQALTPILRVFTYRQYALFMAGMSPYLVTIWMQRVAVGWLAWELTESPVWLGVIAAADLAPVMFLAPIAGAFTDRTLPLRQAMGTQLLNALQAALLAVFAVSGWMTIEILFALTLMNGAVHPFATTARHAIVPATVPRHEFATAFAADSAIFNGSRFVGPAIAGVLIPWGGVASTFALNACACLFFFALLTIMELPTLERAPSKRRRLFSDIVESFAYVRGHAGIWPMFVILTAISVLIRPIQDMLPGFAGAVFDAGVTGLAWLTASMGIGAMISAAWIATRARVTGMTRIVIVGCIGLILATIGFIATKLLWIAVFFGLLSGFTLNTMSTSIQTLTQTVLSDDIRGRVMGTYTLIYRGMPAIGALAVGALAESLGLRATVAIGAALCLGAWLWLLPHRRAMVAALERERP